MDDVDAITLDNLSKNFEFFKACKEIDEIDDPEQLRTLSKAYLKLYFKQQEVVSDLIKLDT
jgi:hypothetical protein